MRIIGHGIDLVEVGILSPFDREWLGPGPQPDLHDVRARTRGPRADHGRAPGRAFAAKEAVLKALGIGWTGDVAWTEIEIEAQPSGAPRVILHGGARDVAAALGVTTWLVSITDNATIVAASAIAISERNTPTVGGASS